MKFNWSLFLILPVMLCSLSSALGAMDQNDKKLPYKVKAAYILNFIRYTEWPLDRFANAKDPVILCLLGDDPFGNILEQTFQGKDITGRNLKVNRLPLTNSALTSCHAVFISGLENKSQTQETLRSLESMPVLTVTDSDGAGQNGAIIHFVQIQGTIQFEINLKVAEKSGLKLSSRMIPLAKKVYN